MASEFTHKETFNMICGEQLGSGCSREVFVYDPDPSLVIKIEENAGSFDNAMEWKLWHDHISHCDWARPLFAEPLHISPCGSVMLQRRTTPATEVPEWVPTIWCDLKRTNYGMIDGRLVCHDFGLSMIPEHGLPKKPRVRRAEWWGKDMAHWQD